MKKIILTIAIVLGIGFGVSAQSDSFFATTSTYTEYRETEWGELPILPNQHNIVGDYKAAEDAPVGTGLLLLAGMGLGYAALRKRD
ncbi:MAG: hypothetical protein IKD32_03745 [Bacteroidales bacterium]|nr:hypothetical protein [Bacteroidales bacterium]